MAYQISDMRKLSALCSFHSPDGLEYVPANGVAAPVQLRMRNVTGDPIQLTSASGPTTITVDFTKAGGTVSCEGGVTLSGFTAAAIAGNVLTLTLAYTQMWWYADAIWIVNLPGFSIDAPAGLGYVDASFTNIFEDDQNPLARLPLIRLAAGGSTNAATGKQLMGMWSEGANSVHVTPRGQTLLPNTLELSLAPPSGVQAEFGASSGVYLGYLSGNWPSLRAVTSPDEAGASGLDNVAGGWTATNVARSRLPMWQLTPGPDNATLSGDDATPSTAFRLTNVTTRERPGPAYMGLYSFGVPGLDDAASPMQVELDVADLSIVSFTANYTTFSDITSPQTVLLQWVTQNASAVTLTGFGTVPVSGSQSVAIEETTSFVLTAFDASMQSVVSATQVVTVTPNLVTRLVPVGTIAAWSGNPNTPPAGWLVCNTVNANAGKTPDLTDKFIVGAGTEAAGTSGDGDTHMHPVNAYSNTYTTSAVDNHTHGMPSNWYARSLSSGGKTGIDTDGTFTTSTQTQGAGSHSHTVAVSVPGFNTQLNSGPVRPAWYALCFIMKVAS